MARTPLFGQLRRALARSLLIRRHGVAFADAVEREAGARSQHARLERRRVLQLGLAAGATAVGCGDDESSSSTTTDKEVAVVGAGIAGLHCAYRLMQAGVKVTVFEASERAGGRMYTSREGFGGQLIELGGELIDTNHATLWALSEELGIELDDRFADEPAGHKREVNYFSGMEIPESAIVAQFTEIAPLMASTVSDAEEDDALFEQVDNISLIEWLDTNVPSAMYPELHGLLDVAYRGEFGLENDEQSIFNLLYLIDYDEPDPFRIFGDSDERWHTHDGNDTFTSKLAEALGEAVMLSHRLASVRAEGGRYVLGLAAADGSSVEHTADHVVFALPFTMLRNVDLTAAGISADKQTIIDELGYGTNAKVMGAFTSKVWRVAHNAGGALTTDLPVQQTWETTIGQDGDQGILTNFLGGDQGLASSSGTADEWFTSVLGDIEEVWPGTEAAYVPGSAVRFHWPTHPHTLGSYTCYRPGQWAFWSTEGVREGNLHFCGEHTSLDFQGWMEGAAESGGLVAMEILDELGVAASALHVVSLGDKLRLPQACYGAHRFRPMRWQRRRRIVRELLGRRRY